VNRINPAIFRAYDVRGLVGSDLTEETLGILGQAAGTYFRERGAHTMVVGRDARLSSPAFQASFIAGLRRTGIDVLDIGAVPTPVMYFALEHLQADAGVVISASHNPPEYNGVKLRRALADLPPDAPYRSEPLPSSEIQELCRIANSGHFAEGHGTLQLADVRDAYVQSATALLQLDAGWRPRVVLDGGNGIGGPYGVQVLEAIGAEVIPLYVEPDGRFPNHHPDPLKADNLRDLCAAVREYRADIGIALDGDGDRLGVVDHQGNIVWADRYLIVLARYLLAQRQGAVVFDVKCSNVLIKAIEDYGGTPVMCKTGYTSISARMRETNAVLGGELSGHTFATYPGHCFDDGTFAGAHLLLALSRLDAGTPMTLVDALAPYPALPSMNEDRIRFGDETKRDVIAYVRERFIGRYPVIEVDGVRVDFGDGWGAMRASNTEPVITTRFEASTEARLHAIRDMMLAAVEEFRTHHQPDRNTRLND
jgi:phosphomannomutase